MPDFATAQPPLTWGPDSPFRYVGGDSSTDFVNTAVWTGRGLLNDRLTGFGRLVDWAVGAGVVTAVDAARLRRAAAARPAEAEAVWRDARLLREIVQRLLAAVATDAPLDLIVARFNTILRDVNSRLQLAVAGAADRESGRAARWTWEEADERLDAVLWPVTRSTAELLASEDARRIRICGGEDCGWMYVDRSRNGLRRWCEMDTCGTRAKTLRRARRRSSSAAES